MFNSIIPITSKANSSPIRSLPRPLFMLLLLLIVVISGIGYAYYVTQKTTAGQTAREQIGAIGDLKAQEIARWLRERERDAATLFYSRLDNILRAFIKNPELPGLQENALQHLASLSRTYNYQAIDLLNARGMPILSFPAEETTLEKQTQVFIKQALFDRQVVFSGIYGQDTPRIDFIVPLLTEHGRMAPPLGALILRIDVQTSLFPLLQIWPTTNTATKILLIRQENNEILYPHEPGQAQDPIRFLDLSLNLTQLVNAIAAQREGTQVNSDHGDNSGDYSALQGKNGETGQGVELEGIDYRNVEVLAAIRLISDSPWYIVAEMAKQEINRPIRRSALRTMAIVLLLMLVVSLIIWAVWRRQIEAVLRDTNRSLVREIGERKYYEARLEHQANYDSLTQLPNRHLLQERLKRAIARAHRTNQTVALFFLDLDRFKTVNDSLGHPVGDVVLQAVATRLKSCIREEDTVARLGGDEFVIVMEGLSQGTKAAEVARQVLDVLIPSFRVERYEFFVTSSIGISLYPEDGADVKTLLKNADVAMYHAKEHGRNNSQFYAPEMNARTLERLVMENNLRYALERKELELYYQPQLSLRSGNLVGVEALLRWRHPKLGMISPAKFIPLAEETGLIVSIGEWTLRTACAQFKTWREEALPIQYVAVNLSPRQFMHANLPVLINQVLAENHLHGSCLELEITEGLIMQDLERAIAVLHILRNMSVQLAIDDFGTGYSSLNHLKRFPLDRLKIDKSFVNDITTDPDDAAIIQAVIAMAHSLRLNVIAEGVESEAQMAFLELHHCDDMQGYYFSPPLPAQDVTLLLRENRTHLVTNRNPIVFQVNSFLGLSEDPSSDTGRGA